MRKGIRLEGEVGSLFFTYVFERFPLINLIVLDNAAGVLIILQRLQL